MAKDKRLRHITTVAVEPPISQRIQRKKDELGADNANEVVEILLDLHDTIAEPGERASDVAYRIRRMR